MMSAIPIADRIFKALLKALRITSIAVSPFCWHAYFQTYF